MILREFELSSVLRVLVDSEDLEIEIEGLEIGLEKDGFLILVKEEKSFYRKKK